MKYHYKVQCQYCGNITYQSFFLEKKKIPGYCKVCNDTHLKIIDKEQMIDYYQTETIFSEEDDKE